MPSGGGRAATPSRFRAGADIPGWHADPECPQSPGVGCDDDPSITRSYDLIFNGVEISTGAQREHRLEVLEQQARDRGLDPEELDFSLDFFRYGVPPHGGFGMGLGRVLMLLHQANLREVTYLFRGPTRLLPQSRRRSLRA